MVDSETTILSPVQTGGLGTIRLNHPTGSFAPTPATRVTLLAVADHREDLVGSGVDWGCGIGVLAIAGALAPGVERIIGLDLSRTNVTTARENARQNGVADRTAFAVSDSFEPLEAEGRALLEPLRGSLDFVLANPPASASNDGFDFRRRVIGEGADFLRPGGLVLVQALSAYGPARVEELAGTEYRYDGVVARTDLVPLDFALEPIRRQHATYVRQEQGGGRPYEFFLGDESAGPSTAVEALDALADGEPVLGRWQVHRFRRLG